MKYKIIILSVLFLSAGLFTSSREHTGINKGLCFSTLKERASTMEIKCVQQVEDISPRNIFLLAAIKPI